MTAIPTASVNDRYQGKIPSGLERVLWKISGKIPVSIVTSKDYAFILSHEVAEMVVDPAANNRNPEVCDGCAGNCDTFWVDCFDNNSNFVGGSQTIPPSFGYSFFINSIIKQDAIDPTSPEFCAKPEIGAQSACVYSLMVHVPPVSGKSRQYAKNKIENAGLQTNFVGPGSLVDYTHPDGGAWVPINTSVTIVMDSGL